jgi:hypothetical protein
MQPGKALAAIAVAAVLATAPAARAEQNPPAKSAKKQAAKSASKPAPEKATPAPPAAESKRAAPPAEPARVVYTPEKPKPPEGAVQIAPGLWSHVDKDGKTWHYRQTPFGMRKTEPEAAAPEAEEDLIGVIAYDRGDTVDFERKTPFSVYRWSKKKTELSKAERNVLERAAQAAGSGSK